MTERKANLQGNIMKNIMDMKATEEWVSNFDYSLDELLNMDYYYFNRIREKHSELVKINAKAREDILKENR